MEIRWLSFNLNNIQNCAIVSKRNAHVINENTVVLVLNNCNNLQLNDLRCRNNLQKCVVYR